MSGRDYLRDNLIGILISIGTWLLVAAVLLCYHAGMELVLFLSVVYGLGMAVRLLWDYLRKRTFYQELADGIEQLDKKYLISEILQEPEFAEGQLFHEILYESGRAMNEHIDGYRREAADFREYIELWVHEIKLPVASLLLMSHNDGENGRKYTEQLHRIDSYIENVLYYSRSESTAQDYIIKPVQLGDCFKHAAVRNRAELLALGASIHTEGLDKVVMTDGKWLEFMLGQLISNSIKYHADDRPLELQICAEETADSVTLHVRDNGKGIPSADLPYIFDKSYTGENGRTGVRSTGMGLYIVKNLCGRLGHKVTAASVQGEYTDISITFGIHRYVRP